MSTGTPRIASYRTVAGYPLVVVVAQSVEEVLAAAKKKRDFILLGALILSVDILAFTAVILRGQQRPKASESKFRSMFEVVPVGIALIGTTGNIRLANRTFAQLTGTNETDLGGRHVDEFLGEENGGDAEQPRRGPSAHNTPHERGVRRSDGSTSTVLCNAAVASSGDDLSWLTIQDISERKRAEDKIWHTAHRDALTRLPNRLYFSEVFDCMLAENRGPARALALLLLDIDNFKVINDTLGHEAGDLMLSKTATRLKRLRGVADLIARPGGDEFALVVRDFRSERRLMRIARVVLRTLRRRVVYRGQSVKTSGSIGIAVAPRHGVDRADLMRSADLALYRAKQLGRNRAVMFEPAMRADAERHYRMVGSFRRAAAENRVGAVYQPQIDLVSGDLVGFEALARVDAGRGRLLPPAEFAAALADSQSCRILGRHMIEQAARDLGAWHDAGLSARVVVNASSFELAQESYAERLIGLLQERRVSLENFEVEITETAFLDDAVPAIVRNIERLAASGVGIALDDFGTGYASLTHLKSLPISRIKIDRTFIASIIVEPESRSIVEAIVRLSHSLGKTVVAEGIEHAEQLDELRHMGCDIGQGFALARPMPIDEIKIFLLRSLGERRANAATVFDVAIAAAAR